MKEYFVAVTPHGPLRMGDLKPRGDYFGTRSYIPGAVLRGALAEWLKAQGRESEIVSLVGRVRFGNLFPSEVEQAWGLPFPTTALECKLEGGFRSTASDREGVSRPGHGIRDGLLLFVAYSELETLGAQFPVPLQLRCMAQRGEECCGGRMERVSGFYVRLPEGWRVREMERGLLTKVALSRYRRAAQEQMLYRVSALRPQGCFVGRIWTDDDSVIDTLREAVEHIGVGALTTRGFGAARLREAKQVSLPSLAERLREFNEKLGEVWRDLADLARQVGNAVPDEPSGTYFSVDLLAPAVLNDTQGLPTLKLCLRGPDGSWLEPIWWATQPTFVGGFSTAWGLPKPTALGSAPGSVYVFRSELPEAQLVSWLENLEAHGVGQRTDEGLGEILVCHPFHREVMPV
ncbi:MAG: CRISPR-associated RAMP protein Csx10 [Candidatus Kapabacteria bacterium]|nr:CRISPR-associated RAMP protein Csx10 [Candidatus Kapabacteria bacterium]MDW8226136.1 CRISPR-associated RAMP protein Csx10 [Bacteroidota bacterium]